MNKKMTNKKLKWVVKAGIAFFTTLLLVVSAIGLYMFNKKKEVENPIEVDLSLSWSVDKWDGVTKSFDSKTFVSDFAGRGDDSKTINSAQSFVYFVDSVNSGNDYEGKTIYLNKNIDLSGYTINSIGTTEHPFKGTFDGGYYFIENANINGAGMFGNTENAIIKNVGLYNVKINSTQDYVGGLVGTATDTNILNSFVRLGEVNGAKNVGGLVGKFISLNGEHKIENSFANTSLTGTNLGGLVGNIFTNLKSKNKVTISFSYFKTESSVEAYNSCDFAGFVNLDNVVKASQKSDLSAWDYSSKFEDYTTWCDYVSKSNSVFNLDFDLPILRNFVKVYLTGSGYENVVKNETTGELENLPFPSAAVRPNQERALHACL